MYLATAGKLIAIIRIINIEKAIVSKAICLKLLQTEKMASHKDAEIIIKSIDQVLGEFATLETVLSTLPPLPDVDPSRS